MSDSEEYVKKLEEKAPLVMELSKVESTEDLIALLDKLAVEAGASAGTLAKLVDEAKD